MRVALPRWSSMLVACLLGCVCHVKTALWSTYWVPFYSPFALVFWFVLFVLLAVLRHDRPRLFPAFDEKGKAWFIACNSCITVTGCAGQYISYKFWKNGSCWILPLRRWLGYPFVRPLFLCFVYQPWVCHQVQCLRLSPLYRSSEMLLCWRAILYQLSVLHGHPLLFAVLVIPDRWNNMSWRYLGKVGVEVLPFFVVFFLFFCRAVDGRC